MALLFHTVYQTYSANWNISLTMTTFTVTVINHKQPVRLLIRPRKPSQKQLLLLLHHYFPTYHIFAMFFLNNFLAHSGEQQRFHWKPPRTRIDSKICPHSAHLIFELILGFIIRKLKKRSSFIGLLPTVSRRMNKEWVSNIPPFYAYITSCKIPSKISYCPLPRDNRYRQAALNTCRNHRNWAGCFHASCS